ncbi:choline ABC transporter substrate-binding protein [Rhizobium sp. KVB221]|uniref:Choline ABC transporter substrate-binding protein n=1 Tax=Rhizobium setariae TaxID=2801340 RepID=A0A937CQT9_9HYPH|nr:choline ABC transporter substrate-binding protein [Rhizobium setariae]MBL0374378.1 choline ABC transporter substrate-binding protein [Rhizobium setariae]
MRKFTAAMLIAINSVSLPSVALAADKEECQAVRMSDLGWTDIALTNTTAEIILKALGYQPTQTLLGLNVTYDALKRGEMDVFLGNWRPVQDIEYKAYYDEGSVVALGNNLEGAKYTLAVPKYVSDAGVKSFADLAAHGDKFGKTIYGIEPGSNLPLVEMLAEKRHGLDGDWKLVESSEAAMLAQVRRAISSNEWIVFLGWQPHPMNMSMEMTYLSGGDQEFGPNFGGATVRTIVRKGYPQDCPNVSKFFTNLAFDIAYENAGMDLIMTKGTEVPAAAREMMAAHPEKLEAWLAGVTTLDGKPGLDAVKAELGMNQ